MFYIKKELFHCNKNFILKKFKTVENYKTLPVHLYIPYIAERTINKKFNSVSLAVLCLISIITGCHKSMLNLFPNCRTQA